MTVDGWSTVAPSTTRPADDRDSWFFIVGCQRSGTTLMRLILECHSCIQCCDESASYNVISGRNTPVRERPLLGLKVPCITEQFADRSLWERLLLPEMPNDYRGQRLIFMMRDVRDTVASMMQLRLQRGSWLETSLLPSLRLKIAKDDAFRRRYASEIAKLNEARHPNLARAAFYWRYKCEALFHYLQEGFPALLVRYEDLTRQPQLELLRVCGFLQVPWEPGLLSHSTSDHTELKDGGHAIGETDSRRPIDTQSLNRWRAVFNDDESDEILRFAGDTQAFMYPSGRC